MKILTAEQIRKADAYTIRHEPIASIDLMERAAGMLFKWINARHSTDEILKIFAGPGNNGGDSLAMARLLFQEGFGNVEVFLLRITDKLSPDSDQNRKRLGKETQVKIVEITTAKDFPTLTEKDVVIDALFGSGLSRALEGLAKELVDHINGQSTREVISVDIPSGLFCDGMKGLKDDSILRADFTLSFQFPKLAFFFPENENYVGKFRVLPIGLHPDFIKELVTPYFYIESEGIRAILKPRRKFSHKGTYGHGLLIAGSYGMMGAAVLAARAAVRSGLGLLTSHVPRLGVGILQTSVPESLISIDESDLIFTGYPLSDNFSAIAIGPGLNQKSNTRKGLFSLLEEIKVPVVIDADGLNILAGQENWPELLPENAILTPHPKEFERLFGSFPDSYTRLKKQSQFSRKYKCTIVLKGAHTCITDEEGNAHFNSTGNPGMAKGGCGDVLTGIILGLLAQGHTPKEAAIAGVFIHGSAGDLGTQSNGLPALIPSDLIDNLGMAFSQLETRI